MAKTSSGRSTWFTGAPEVVVDRDEVVVVGALDAPELPAEVAASDRTAAEQGRVQRFREQTREQRMHLADEAEDRLGRKVARGVQAVRPGSCSPRCRYP